MLFLSHVSLRFDLKTLSSLPVCLYCEEPNLVDSVIGAPTRWAHLKGNSFENFCFIRVFLVWPLKLNGFASLPRLRFRPFRVDSAD